MSISERTGEDKNSEEPDGLDLPHFVFLSDLRLSAANILLALVCQKIIPARARQQVSMLQATKMCRAAPGQTERVTKLTNPSATPATIAPIVSGTGLW